MSKKENQNIAYEKGIYENLEIIPSISKREEKFNEMIKALIEGKQFVFPVGYAKNSVYLTQKRIRDKTNIAVSFGQIQKTKDSPKQFVIYMLQIE